MTTTALKTKARKPAKAAEPPAWGIDPAYRFINGLPVVRVKMQLPELVLVFTTPQERVPAIVEAATAAGRGDRLTAMIADWADADDDVGRYRRAVAQTAAHRKRLQGDLDSARAAVVKVDNEAASLRDGMPMGAIERLAELDAERAPLQARVDALARQLESSNGLTADHRKAAIVAAKSAAGGIKADCVSDLQARRVELLAAISAAAAPHLDELAAVLGAINELEAMPNGPARHCEAAALGE